MLDLILGLDEILIYPSPKIHFCVLENVDVAPYVKFQCGSHHVGSSFRRAGAGHSQSITVGDGCWIGMSSLILGGAHIGSGTVVAAGSVVLAGTYPENVLLAGVPAKIHKKFT